MGSEIWVLGGVLAHQVVDGQAWTQIVCSERNAHGEQGEILEQTHSYETDGE